MGDVGVNTQISRKRKNHTGSKNKMKAKKPKGEVPIKSKSPIVNIPVSGKQCGANWKVLLSELNNEKNNIETGEKKKPSKKFKERYKNKKKTEKKKDVNNNSPEVWFDDVEPEDLLSAENDSDPKSKQCGTDKLLIKQNAYSGLTKAIGMDCEMVGVGQKGTQSILARVSLVNQFGKCIYDKHVKPRENVTDYRTWVSGIRPSDLKGAEDFLTVQREVAEILKGRVLVGHALKNDLTVLYLDHPKKMVRDTAEYAPFRVYNKGRTPGLRHLCKQILGVDVQKGEHSSVQDAQAAMRLYTFHKKQWEKELRQNKK